MSDLEETAGDHRPRFDVLVLAELNVDVVLQSDEEPQFGQVEQQVAMGAITLGSSGAITAAALAALGLRVAVCGVLGDDHVADLVTSMLTGLAVDVSGVSRRPARSSGITMVLTRSDGDRALMTFPGTMADFTVSDIPAQLLQNCRHVHISSIYLQSALTPGLPALLSDLNPAVTVSLDPGWDPARRWTDVEPLLSQVDWFLPNANECAAIAGGDLETEAAARRIAAQGPCVVVKMGTEGALAVPPDGGPVVRVAGRARKPVDTTGAGDNFDAGFIASLLGATGPAAATADALALGCACGAISTGGLGGTGRLATAPEALELASSLLLATETDTGRPVADTGPVADGVGGRTSDAATAVSTNEGAPRSAEHQELEHR